MKRFLSILLAVVMVLSMVTPVFAGSFEDTKGTKHETAIEFLTGLGIVNGKTATEYDPDGIVTRAEMAKLLVYCLKLESGADILKDTVSFDDVAGHWAIGYINVASQYGLIKGDGDGNFRPDDTVNYAEAITMIIRTLGKGKAVESQGQWPTNYIAEAGDLELLDNVDEFKSGEGATRGAVAEMIWNMLNRPMWYLDSENRQNGEFIYKESGEKMLTIKFPKFDYTEKWVDIGSIVVMDKDTIAIDGMDFDNLSVAELITAQRYKVLTEKVGDEVVGRVIVFTNTYEVSDEEYKVVLGMVEDYSNKSITIDDTKYSYDSSFEPANEYFGLAFVNLNENNKVETIGGNTGIVEASKGMLEGVVKKVEQLDEDKEEYTITFFGGETATIKEEDGEYIVSIGNYTNKSVVLSDIDGKLLSIDDIKEYLTLSVVALDTDNYAVLVNDTKVEGKISEIKDGMAIIDGTGYKFHDTLIKYSTEKTAKKLEENAEVELINDEITAYVTLNRYISYIEAEEKVEEQNYGFLTQKWYSVDADGNSVNKVKIMTLDGEEVVYELCDEDGEVFVNNVIDGEESKIETTLNTELLKYELLDGKYNVDAKEAEGYSEDEIVELTISDDAQINETRKVIKASTAEDAKEYIITSSTKYVLAEVENEKLTLSTFKFSDINKGDTVTVITEKDSNKVLYVVSQKELSSSDDNLAIVVSSESTTKDEDDKTINKVDLYNVATRKIETVVLTKSYDLAKGTVVKYEVTTSDKYTLEAVDAKTIVERTDEAGEKETYEEAGDGFYKVLGADLVVADAENNIIFVTESDGEWNVSVKGTENFDAVLKNGYEVYGAEEHDDSEEDDVIYKTIIVVKK